MLASLVFAVHLAHAAVAAQRDSSQTPATSAAQPDAPWPPAGVFRPVAGVTAPRVIKSARPNYPADAMRARIQGTVKMEAVIKADGTVGEVRVVRSLDRKFGVDEAAVKAVKEMRFSPGTKDGEPVSVLVSTEMAFSLK
jgi:protein TonB